MEENLASKKILIFHMGIRVPYRFESSCLFIVNRSDLTGFLVELPVCGALEGGPWSTYFRSCHECSSGLPGQPFFNFLSLSVDSLELAGYGRATFSGAARTSLFRLINMQNMALRASPTHCNFAAPPVEINDYRENPVMNPSSEKILKVCYSFSYGPLVQ